MITPEKIEEWIKEVEERPSSGSILMRYIADRLARLSERNEELAAENIQLRSGARVEAYEAQIESLQYQLDLLKRQLGGDVQLEEKLSKTTPVANLNAIMYTSQGKFIRVELPPDQQSGEQNLAARITHAKTDDDDPGILIAAGQDELLLLFDTGRTVTIPVLSIPAAKCIDVDWKDAHIEEPRGAENLATIASIGRMPLAEHIIQVSRKGCVKKMLRSGFEGYLAKNFIGAGVKAAKDRSCEILLAQKNDFLIMVTYEGYLLCLNTDRVSYSIEETLRLGTYDYVVNAFLLGKETSLIGITQIGKVIHRETGWLKTPAGGGIRSKGQMVFSDERRNAGTRLLGLQPFGPTDTCVVLDRKGNLRVYPIQALIDHGIIPPVLESQNGDEKIEYVSFAILPGERSKSK